MPKRLISNRTCIGFRENLVGWTLRTISDQFDAEDIKWDSDCDPGLSGQRRTLVEQYYHSLDLTDPNDVQKLLRVFESILIAERAYNPQAFDHLAGLLKRDGYIFEDDRLIALSPTLPTLEHARRAAIEFDADYMTHQIERINAAIESDPDLAIGSSKELLESCCKTILADRGQETADNEDLPALVKGTMKELEILPENIPDTAKGAEAIKRLLNNLLGVARGLTEVRNLYGSGHGRHGRASSMRPRHAKLAVGAATTLVVFLYETHVETRGSRGNNDS